MIFCFSNQVSSPTTSCEYQHFNLCPSIRDQSDILDNVSIASIESSVPTDSSDDQIYQQTVACHTLPIPENMEKVLEQQKQIKQTKRKRSNFINAHQRTKSLETVCKEDALEQIYAEQPTIQSRTSPDQAQVQEQPSCDVSYRPIRPIPFWSSIDQTVGPEGPPNITWASSDPLETVREFFLPSCEMENKWNESVSEPNIYFQDQTQFLSEQATILPGRSPCFASNSNGYLNNSSYPNPDLFDLPVPNLNYFGNPSGNMHPISYPWSYGFPSYRISCPGATYGSHISPAPGFSTTQNYGQFSNAYL